MLLPIGLCHCTFLLKTYLAVPLIFVSLVSGISNLRDTSKLKVEEKHLVYSYYNNCNYCSII